MHFAGVGLGRVGTRARPPPICIFDSNFCCKGVGLGRVATRAPLFCYVLLCHGVGLGGPRNFKTPSNTQGIAHNKVLRGQVAMNALMHFANISVAFMLFALQILCVCFSAMHFCAYKFLAGECSLGKDCYASQRTARIVFWLQWSVVWGGLPRKPQDHQNDFLHAVTRARSRLKCILFFQLTFSTTLCFEHAMSFTWGMVSGVLEAGGLTGWVGSKGFSRAQGPPKSSSHISSYGLNQS